MQRWLAQHEGEQSQADLLAAINAQVRKMPSWPRSWANFKLLQLYSHENAWASLHLLGQPNAINAQYDADCGDDQAAFSRALSSQPVPLSL